MHAERWIKRLDRLFNASIQIITSSSIWTARMSATSTWILCATSRIRHTLHQPCFLAPASHVRNYAFAPTNSRLSPQSNHLTRPPALASLSTPSDHAQAKTWVERFKKEKLLRSDVELQFSRSSGPGGQVGSSTFSGRSLSSILHVRLSF